jgi:hypothetical protein
MTGVQFPTGLGKGQFSLCHNVQTSYETHAASYPMVTGASFLGSGYEADHLLPYNAKAKNLCHCTSTSPYDVFMVWCFKKAQDLFSWHSI